MLWAIKKLQPGDDIENVDVVMVITVSYLLHYFIWFSLQSMHILHPFLHTGLYLSRSLVAFTLSDPAATSLSSVFSVVSHWFCFQTKTGRFLFHWLFLSHLPATTNFWSTLGFNSGPLSFIFFFITLSLSDLIQFHSFKFTLSAAKYIQVLNSRLQPDFYTEP